MTNGKQNWEEEFLPPNKFFQAGAVMIRPFGIAECVVTNELAVAVFDGYVVRTNAILFVPKIEKNGKIIGDSYKLSLLNGMLYVIISSYDFMRTLRVNLEKRLTL